MEKYERINLDEYVQTGEGGTAVSYIHREAGDTLVKLYNPGFEADKDQEVLRMRRTASREDQNPGNLVLATCWSIPGRPESHKSGPGHVLGLTVLARVAPPVRKIPYLCTKLWKIISLEKLTGLEKC